jgi:multiple sugar transport system substrate-binding protein
VDGRLQCVPQNVSSLVVYLNADAFEKAGVGDAREDWRYDQFLAAAEKLKAAGVDAVGVEPGIVRASASCGRPGGEVVDRTDDPTRFTLDTPRRGAALEAPRRAARARPVAERQGGRVALARRAVHRRSLAMFMSSRREVPNFRTIERFDWDVAAFPRAEEDFTVLHSDAYCVAKRATARPPRRSCEYASGPKGQELLARSGPHRAVASRGRSLARVPRPSQPPRRPRSSSTRSRGSSACPPTRSGPRPRTPPTSRSSACTTGT